MKTSIASLFLGFFVALWLTPLARRLAVRFRLVDRSQDGRRVNQKTIPRAGGLAIAAAVFAPILVLAFYENGISHAIYDDLLAEVVLFLGALAALLVGLADDLFRPSAKLRLLALIGIAVLTWFGGYQVEQVDIPLLGQINLGFWSLPVTVLWIVGVIVAFNFVDGLDGLAGGIALISTATLFVCAAFEQNVLLMTWTGAMAGALLGFLVFNFNPASIFMGDAGSNFLGYLLAVVALQTSRKQNTAVALLVPMCILGLPLLDAALTMIRRALLREGLFTSERGHLHHRLLDLGLSHRKAVLVLYAVTTAFCLGAMSIMVPTLQMQIISAVIVAVLIFGLMFATGYIRPRDLLHMYHRGKKNERRQQHVVDVCQELAQCLQTLSGTPVELSQVLEELVERGCVTAVQHRCEHNCEVVAGEYDHSAKGARLTVLSGRSGAATAIVFWKDLSTDPSPRESEALRKLLAEVECYCIAAAPTRSYIAPIQKMPGRQSAVAQLEKVWVALVESADRLSLRRLSLEMDLPWHPEGFNATWEKDPPEETEESWRIDVPVMSEARVVGWLKVAGDPRSASNRQNIVSLLDILETSESYLKSIFQDQGQISIPVPAPHFGLISDRAAQATATLPNTGLEEEIDYREKVDTSR